MRRITYLSLLVFLLQACTMETPETEETPVVEVTNEDSTEDSEESELPEYLAEPIDYLPEAIGKFTREITTDNPEAQKYFTQGIQLKYAFAVNEAVRSFRMAWKQDSTCAMCYYGEAWAMGGYLNGAMSEEKAPHALKALNKAIELSDNCTDIEKSLINAMKVRYIEDYDRSERRVQDSLYALSMKEVYDQYPEDLDVATIYAEALFLLEPRRGTREMDDPDVMRIHAVLEKVLDTDIQHPGACHLYLHATESTNQPELGESCADYLGSSIPGASHINHMPSHTWNEVGRWGESVQANIQAVKSDQKSKAGKAVAIYPTHNLHMLLYAASFDGQGMIATSAGRDFAKQTGNSMFYVMTLLRFGRFDEILEVEESPDGDIPQGLWEFAQGYARLKTGETDFARMYLNRVLEKAESSDDSFRFHPAEQVLGVVAAILEGEIAWMEDDLNGARRSFERAVKIEDSMTYDEPEIYPFSARHWLGALQLHTKNYAAAEKTYRDEIDDHPHNGWSLYGLLEALKAQSKSTDGVQEDFDQSWARSDVYIESSKF